MKHNMKKVLILAVVAVMSMCIVLPGVIGDTANIAIKWYIPSDLGITIQYPTGKAHIEFRPSGQTFVGEDADGQDSGTSAMNVTNSGNVDMDLDANISGSFDLPAGVTYFNLSTTFGNENEWWWTPANETTQQTIDTSLGMGNTQEYWCWSSGTNVANTTYPLDETKLKIESSAS